jgi:hypothetical protein
MNSPTLQQLIPVIQTSVSPVILISGIGLLLLSMTNRLGRIIDRSRLLVEAMPRMAAAEQKHVTAQVTVLYQRAKIIRLVIILSTTSVLLAGFLVISLFFSALLQLESAFFVILCFILCMAALIASLLLFLIELQMSLRALRLELTHTGVTDE